VISDMSDQPTNEPDIDLDREDLRDRHGNRVTREYVQVARVTCVPAAHHVGWAYPFPSGDLPAPRSAAPAGCGRR
jgi:hypothetical protein